MKAGDICTRAVESLSSTASLRDAAIRMKELDVGFLPVIEGDAMVGVITDRDIVVHALADEKDPDTTTVSEVMTTSLVTCSEEEDIEQAARLMEEQQVRRLIVTDVEGRVCGILSLGDIAAKAHTLSLVGEAVEHISQPCEPRR